MEEEELKERLFPLWGRKLGYDESREARSADWVLNALSDYNNQIQARDKRFRRASFIKNMTRPKNYRLTERSRVRPAKTPHASPRG